MAGGPIIAGGMGRSKKKKADPKDAYRRVRKPVPPPGKILDDRRRKIADDLSKRETEREQKDEEG